MNSTQVEDFEGATLSVNPLLPGQTVRVSEAARMPNPLGPTPTDNLPSYERILALPMQNKKTRFLQEKVWLGMVMDLETDGFSARLKDYEGGPDLETSFEFKEIPQED